jgi:hypothetical protein
MEPASARVSKAAFRITLWAAQIVVMIPMLGGRNLAQSEPAKPSAVNEQTSLVRLTMPGWTEKAPGDGMRYWHDSDGDVIALAVFPEQPSYPFESNETEQRKWCRAQAEAKRAGLIEVRTTPSKIRPSASFVYKLLEMPAYIYLGQLTASIDGATVVWTVVAREHGTTGVREAVVTTNLMKSGKLTLDGYKQSWAQDPYDPTYHGVDRSVLRFMSDDESYDAQFPQHPLSKVRRVLAALPDAAQYAFDKPKDSDSRQ